MNFYDKLKKLCVKNGVSVTKVAVDIGLSEAAQTSWKKLKGNPRASTLKSLSDYFSVPIEYFTSDDEEIISTVEKSSVVEPVGNSDTMGKRNDHEDIIALIHSLTPHQQREALIALYTHFGRYDDLKRLMNEE